SQFNDPGTNTMYKSLMDLLVTKTGNEKLKSSFAISNEMSEKIYIIPPARTRYLSEISENNRNYDKWAKTQAAVAQKLFGIHKTIQTLQATDIEDKDRLIKELQEVYSKIELDLDPKNKLMLENWTSKKALFT